ncbi:hypothetical protein [Streptomyces sp. NPDC002394]
MSKANEWQLGAMTTKGVVTLRGEAELVRCAGALFEGVRREFLCAAGEPGTWSAAAPRARRALPPGVVVRKLYGPGVFRAPDGRELLGRLGEAGAEIRISPAPPVHEAIVVDRRLAVLAAPRSVPGEPRTYSVVQEPDVVAGMRALFETAWETSTDLATYRRTPFPRLGDAERAVLRALAAGHTDEAASRLRGVSLRTYRRRVAALMTALNARSRFQAGLRAREILGRQLGHLTVPELSEAGTSSATTCRYERWPAVRGRGRRRPWRLLRQPLSGREGAACAQGRSCRPPPAGRARQGCDGVRSPAPAGRPGPLDGF